MNGLSMPFPSVQDIPMITKDLPGIGGRLRSVPSHFIVEEVPLYGACGEGEHVYVFIEREGWTTRALQEELAALFGLKPSQVGCAGLKDKHARAAQCFSLHLNDADEDEVSALIAQDLSVRVLWARRHRNKLKTGHLLGNRFKIVVAGVVTDAEKRALDILAALQEKGLPNFYGEQRFGIGGENAADGLAILRGRGPRRSWKRRFLLSALQAQLFNCWLATRIELGQFNALMEGDIAKKTDTGGLFLVEDISREGQRFRTGEITYTGPIYGARMREAAGPAGDLEQRILAQHGVTREELKRAGLKGTRRVARLLIHDMEMVAHPDGLLFSFFLPKGSYATILLRELMKPGTSHVESHL